MKSTPRLIAILLVALSSAHCGYMERQGLRSMRLLGEAIRDDLIVRQKELLFQAPVPEARPPISVHYQRGLEARAEQRWGEALDAFEAFCIEHPNTTFTRTAMIYRAEAHMALGEHDEAAALLEAVWSDRYCSADQGALAASLAGQALLQEGEFEEARDVLRAATLRWGDRMRGDEARFQPWLVYENLARAEHHAGAWARAVETFRFLQARWPDREEARHAAWALSWDQRGSCVLLAECADDAQAEAMLARSARHGLEATVSRPAPDSEPLLVLSATFADAGEAWDLLLALRAEDRDPWPDAGALRIFP